jgi:hypothetical protein
MGVLKMKKLLFTTAAIIVLVTGAANAFVKASPAPIEDSTTLECVPTSISPPDHDRNPTYKIVVNLELDSGQLRGLSATHVAVNGNEYDRNEQYGNANIWQKPGYTEWYWQGTRLRGDRSVMTGRLYRTAGQQWFYEETNHSMHLVSRCHISLDGSE